MNRLSKIIIVLVIVASFYFLKNKENNVPVDFDASLQTEKYPELLKDSWPQAVLPVFKELYNKNNLSRVTQSKKLKIPKIIHQIWLGSPFPEKYKAFQESWKKYNPDWEYILWTEETLKNIPMHNRDMYETARNYGEKSDIARYEILYLYGGLYVDTDFECLKPFDNFNYGYDFYIGIQPLDTNILQLGIGLIGCAPNNMLMGAILHNLQNQKNIAQIITKTGPIYVTRVFCALALQQSDIVCAFPPTFFYPCGYTHNLADRNSWIKSESYAIHHWAGSWLSKDAFVKG